jgi:membrane protein required for colicin V production
MGSFDIILFVVLAVFMYAGWRKGLLRKLIALICLALSLVIATKYASTVGAELSKPLGLSPGAGTTICFLLIVGTIMLAQAIFYSLVIKKLGEGVWNKIGGLVMGLLEGGILLSVTVIFLSIYFHYPSEQTRSASILYKPLKNFAPRLFDSVNTFFPESEDFYEEIMNSGKRRANH